MKLPSSKKSEDFTEQNILEADLLISLLMLQDNSLGAADFITDIYSKYDSFDKVFEALGQFEEMLGKRSIQLMQAALLKAMLRKIQKNKQ